MQTLSGSIAPGRKTDRFLLAWLAIGLVTVLAMAFVTPPFQTPDEAQHYFRAYQISEGTLVADVQGDISGGELPASLETFAKHFLGPILLHAPRPVNPMPLTQTFAQSGQPLDAGKRDFINFSGLSFYAPLAYSGQAVAMAAGRHAGAGPFALFYLARVVNGLCALAVLYCALRLLPFGKELVAFIALLPMPMSLYGSCSPDAMIISTAFLFTALVINRMWSDTWGYRDTLVSILCATTFCAIKPVYAPILMLGFFGIFCTSRRTAVVTRQAAVLAMCLIATFVWLRITAPAMVAVRTDISVSGQIAHILNAPAGYLHIIASSFWWQGFYYRQFVGVLGWLTIPLPLAAYLLPPIAVVAAWGSEQRVHPYRVALFSCYCMAIIAVSTSLLMTALYVTWTPVGNWLVEGVQGRYFLPLAPLGALVFLSLSGRKKYWKQSTTQAVILCLILLEAGMTLATLADRYAVF
jgi:uncharacterized membrane protein